MKNRLLHVVFCVCALFWGMHCSASEEINIDIQNVETKGGIGFWFVNEKTLPVVSISMAFKNAGSFYDPEDKKGLASLATSVIERGTIKGGKRLSEQLQEKGIVLSINADEDNTYVFLKTLAENLDFALSVAGECLVDADIDKGVFAIEKEHQKYEAAASSSDPVHLANAMLARIVFGNQPHAYPVDGTVDTVERITLDDIENYRRENFDLNKMFIGVVGDVSKERISNALDKAFSKIARGQNSKNDINGTPDIGARGYVKYDSPQSVIVFAAKGISRDDPNYHIARILSNAIGGIGLSSVLMQELRENLGITYNVGSALQHFGGANLFSGILFTDTNTAQRGVEAFLNTIEHVKNNGLDERTFKIAKEGIKSNFMFSFLKTSAIATKLVDLQLQGQGIDYVKNYNSKYESVTLQDVNKFAKSFLGDFSIVEAGIKNNIGAKVTA